MDFGWTAARGARHIRRVLALLALLAGWFAGAPSWAASIERIAVADGRITLTFDARIARASTFVLDAPRRIALDLEGATPSRAPAAGGPVTAVRQGIQPGGARVVFDLSRPAVIAAGRFASDGRTLTLTLASADDERFAAAAKAPPARYAAPGEIARPIAAAAMPASYRVAMRLPAAAKAPPLPAIAGDATRPLVVIDAGHGGRDPGALSPDGALREKDLTLKTARAIRDALLASGRVRVAMTRDDDRFLILQERYGIARRLGADLFISIHCDSAGNPEATGATVYTLSEVASDKEAARLAARENKADIIAGVDLGDQTTDISSILIDLAQRETMNTSASFARLLGREARPLIPTKAAFHRMASLVVLKAPDMPSILFETGYISNQRDAELLNSREGRANVAESVRRAVEVHFATRLASR